jgi:hypothetical protein
MGGNFANWGLMFSVFDCTALYIRQKVSLLSTHTQLTLLHALDRPSSPTVWALVWLPAWHAAVAYLCGRCPHRPVHTSCVTIVGMVY